MKNTQVEQYGQLALTTIFSNVWLGDWDRYEKIFQSMDEDLMKNFEFHEGYNRDEVNLWYENHFCIPGDYFISPYFSSYSLTNDESGEERKKNLLCLIGIYEKTGFHFPLERELYPDHIGCMTTFIGAIQQEKIKANQNGDSELYTKLCDLENEIAVNYIQPTIREIKEQAMDRFQHPFFKEFLTFFYNTLNDDYSS